MASPEHLAILKQGVEAWNQWREMNPQVAPDLSGVVLSDANLSGANLCKVDFSEANLAGANLSRSQLSMAKLYKTTLARAFLQRASLVDAFLMDSCLHEADLTRAILAGANLTNALLVRATLCETHFGKAELPGADLSKADLSKADLRWTDLSQTRFCEANLSGANLRGARLDETDFENANLEGCAIYGISAWGVKLTGAKQSNLIITNYDEPVITIDNLEVAQFIYLLLNNEKIRQVIDTITSKVVLILGRFTPERKAVLDAIRDELRRHDYLPVLFDSQKPDSRDFIETVSTLAHMARFVIADLTEPRIVLEEMPHIVRNIAVPLVPLLLEGEEEPVTLYNLRRNHCSVLPTCWYTDRDGLLASLEEKVIAPAQAKTKELQEMR